MKQLIETLTNPNDVVLDSFMGSGSTCVAAKQLGRRYIGIELNEEYYNIAKARLNALDEK
jgi:site-specific DNA-methyltransferase (adenine-specific)